MWLADNKKMSFHMVLKRKVSGMIYNWWVGLINHMKSQ